jgi:hypothetical protein
MHSHLAQSRATPSHVISKAIELAGASQRAWEQQTRPRIPGAKSDPRAERKQTVERRQALRNHLDRQSLTALSHLMRVVRVGTGEVTPEEAATLSNPTRSERFDRLVDALVAEIHLAAYLQDGLAQLGEKGIDIDALAG